MSWKTKSLAEIQEENREKIQLFQKLDILSDSLNDLRLEDQRRSFFSQDHIIANENAVSEGLEAVEELNKSLEELLKKKEVLQMYLTQDVDRSTVGDHARILVGSYEAQEMFKGIITTLVNLDLSNYKEVIKDTNYYMKIVSRGDQIWRNAIQSSLQTTNALREMSLPLSDKK